MDNQVYSPTQNYKVVVRTITYNHVNYITDTLDGVAMQQTNFPFVHYVIDDCSTDGEQEVIKVWLNEHCDMDNAEFIDLELANVILVPHKTNQNLSFAIYLLKRNLWKEPKLKETLVAPWRDHCEYEALCEGDDYWIHPHKLQMQVDFMDEHPDYSMCYTYFRTIDENNQEIFRDNYECAKKMSKSGDILYDLLITNFILTCTTIFRSNVFKTTLYNSIPYKYDYSSFLTASVLGYCKCIEHDTAAYRKTPTGAMATQKSVVSKMFQETKLFFYNGLTNGSIDIERKRLSSKVIKLIMSYCLYNEDEDYKERYRAILKNSTIRPYLLWAYIKYIIAKKILKL